MILLTCGTNEQPFDRLVSAAWSLGGSERLVVQHGASQVQHGDGEWVDFVSFEELADLMHEARVVVCHAGVGSIMLARRCDKVPIVVPRRLHLNEAVDDHQLPLARRLHKRGIVTLVEDEIQLPDIVRGESIPAGYDESDALPGADALSADLHAALIEAMVPASSVHRFRRRATARV